MDAKPGIGASFVSWVPIVQHKKKQLGAIELISDGRRTFRAGGKLL